MTSIPTGRPGTFPAQVFQDPGTGPKLFAAWQADTDIAGRSAVSRVTFEGRLPGVILIDSVRRELSSPQDG